MGGEGVGVDGIYTMVTLLKKVINHEEIILYWEGGRAASLRPYE